MLIDIATANIRIEAENEAIRLIGTILEWASRQDRDTWDYIQESFREAFADADGIQRQLELEREK